MTKSAIILFAHLPDFEARAKSLSYLSSIKTTKKISTYLTQHFYKLSQQTTADTFLIDTYHQKGKTFGERISNAYADIYAKGYDNVICIGNDCPDLDLQSLQKAITETESGNVVLGPTQDGGTYLIGIPKERFNQFDFQNSSWQTNKNFKSLKSQFQHNFVKLETFEDFDKEKDLHKNNFSNPIAKVLFHIINFYRVVAKAITCSPLKSILLDATFLKGPPQYSI